MESKTIHLILLFIFISPQFHSSYAQTWIRAGYWYASGESPIPDINSALFTHLICGFANVSSSSYQLIIPSADQQYYSSFTEIVKRKNPSIITLLSIWNGQASTAQGILGEKVNSSVLSSMLNQSSSRSSFIESSIQIARRYGFWGIDLFWLWPNTEADMINLGKLLDEWRAAVDSEPRNSSLSKLMLTMAVKYVPSFGSMTYPIESMKKNLDFAHVVAYDYHLPLKENVTGAHAALYNPTSHVNTDYGIRQWLNNSFPASKLVMGLPYHGYAWTLANPNDNGIGAPAAGVAVTQDGSMSYKYIKWYTRSYEAKIMYNASYVVNYCIIGLNWIGFDDVEAIRAKIAYAKEKKLLGYNVFVVTNDDNWALSWAAQDEENAHGKKRRLLLIIFLPITMIIILIASVVCYLQRKLLKTKGKIILRKLYRSESAFTSGSPSLQEFSFSTIKAATNTFSSENLLGEGGFGPVYKGKLRNGQEIAVKRLSKTSTQGLEEFRNEVTLTARLEHVNLVRVLGFCSKKEEKMLIYEYMPNKSLDFYLFDPSTKHFLDWTKRVHVIEGVTQGLLYLQEYSNLTIIHRDLKASNILLDHEMNAKISDFGMAKLFKKDEVEGNTGRIVGTYGYVPPEYVNKGIYSMKYDVYSFGVLLLQMISGRRSTSFYGPNRSLHLLEYAYESWREDKGVEFIDPALDDSSSSCKLLRCLQVALLCVQENPDDRPTMLEVYSMLKSDTEVIPIPTKTAFSGKRDEHMASTSTSQQAVSVNDAQISELLPR
ncbi:putative protein kinase RLK-Pelle-DLSV family [Rosa chinensis]|uniref:Uncharacterized protein n=1 Tax=Rosa chinensis TaxID=74649 RepID=A0A2P6RIB6_ROSCH|nr:cysteine-rich receptor-like protein kinase 10 [Rosa chinensis]PRQ46184.1 putative protein kinase RLK-Pelle-DLSV family [Rosa chinensis]